MDADERLAQAAIRGGPSALSEDQKNALLNDPFSLSRLHFKIWSSPEALAGWDGGKVSHGMVASSAAVPAPSALSC
jgi:membrane glycosyltransferase